MPYADPQKEREYRRKRRMDPEYRDRLRKYYADWRAKNPTYEQDRQASDHKKFLKRLWFSAQARKKFFAILPSDVYDLWDLQKGKCALTGIELTHVFSSRKFSTNASLDRVDNSKGYTKDNIRLVCTAVNKMRSDMSDEEFISWCKLVARPHVK